jgi:hypothetical protein
MSSALKPRRKLARLRALIPMRDRVRFRVNLPGGVLGELTLLWMTGGRWRRRAEATMPEWNAWVIGPFVLGWRLMW